MTITTYSTLKEKYGTHGLIPYSELLTTQEWSDRRESIIKRDQYSCTECRKMATMPHRDEVTGITYHLWFGEERIESKNEYEDILVQNITGSTKPYCLQVHHKFYVLENLPWEYKDEDLITLCNWCHTAFHEVNSVSVYKSNKEVEMLKVSACSRCSGVGWLSEYIHVQNGVCFQCNGYGYEYRNL